MQYHAFCHDHRTTRAQFLLIFSAKSALVESVVFYTVQVLRPIFWGAATHFWCVEIHFAQALIVLGKNICCLYNFVLHNKCYDCLPKCVVF